MPLLWLILPFIFIPLIALFAILYIMYRNRALTAIPGPPPIPFFGNKNPGNVQEIYDLIADNVHRYGEISRLYFGPLIRILTCDIEIMEYILKSNVHLKKSNIYDLLKEWIGEGLLIISGKGFDTVSRALAFALYDLGQNPGVQSKLYDEIIATFGEEVENLSQKQINELPYLDMVVKEVLRLHSSVPFIERKLEQDATIGGKFFPKDTVFTLLLHWMNWNPKYFPDPEKFDPERFSPENARKIPNFAYVPFSAGPRNCIGQRFATMELKLAIVHLLKDLEILPVPGHKLNLVYSSLLESSTGILIRIAKRNKN